MIDALTTWINNQEEMEVKRKRSKISGKRNLSCDPRRPKHKET